MLSMNGRDQVAVCLSPTSPLNVDSTALSTALLPRDAKKILHHIKCKEVFSIVKVYIFIVIVRCLECFKSGARQ